LFGGLPDLQTGVKLEVVFLLVVLRFLGRLEQEGLLPERTPVGRRTVAPPGWKQRYA